MAFSAKGRTQTALAEINVTPLVDVVLVLLLIFMLTAPVLQSGVVVAIPKTRSVNQLTEERMVVTIDKDQNVFLQDKPVNVNELPDLPEAAPAPPSPRSASSTCAPTSGFPSAPLPPSWMQSSRLASPTSASSPSRSKEVRTGS